MPTPPDHRHARQVALLELVRESAIARQDQLADALTARGFEVTQSSVSRDLRELGVVKVRGRYVAPGAVVEAIVPAPARQTEALLDALHFVRDVRTAGPHLTLLITAIGAAQTVAIALDRCGWPEVVGTVAGDDTILVATAGLREQVVLLKHLENLRAAAPSSSIANSSSLGSAEASR